MASAIKHLKTAYKEVFTKSRMRSLGVAFTLLALALFFHGYANSYSMRNDGQFVGDFFLDNLPTINLNIVIVEGALIAIIFGVLLLLLTPRYIIFTLKAAALLIATRAFFVAVTHLGIYPDQVLFLQGRSSPCLPGMR